MNQSVVKEIYLRIIDATIEGSRAEINERGTDDSAMESLNLLKSRWTTRLVHTHDFTDDPDIIDKPSSSAGKGGKKGSAKNAKKGHSPKSPKSPSKPSSSRNGVLSVASLTNQTDDSKVPASSKAEPSLIRQRDANAQTDPPAKRRRVDIDDGPIPDRGEDLDSEDSDDEDADDDEEAENIILAQHDRVKKGPKWKVILREGIVSIRGREYLFNKATCDLDF